MTSLVDADAHLDRILHIIHTFIIITVWELYSRVMTDYIDQLYVLLFYYMVGAIICKSLSISSPLCAGGPDNLSFRGDIWQIIAQ